MLYLDKNNLEDRAFDGTFPSTLKELSLDKNCLTKVPTRLPDGLELFSASFCYITNISSLPHGLTHLYLQGNSLQEIPDLSGLTQLEILSLDSNMIERLGPLPPTLEKLFLSNNKLKEFPALPVKLQRLEICQNHIRRIPSQLPLTLTVLLADNNHIDDVRIHVPPRLCFLSLNENWLTKTPVLEGSYRRTEVIIHMHRNFVGDEFEWHQIKIARLRQRLMLTRFIRSIARCRRIRDELFTVAMHPNRLGQFEDLPSAWFSNRQSLST